MRSAQFMNAVLAEAGVTDRLAGPYESFHLPARFVRPDGTRYRARPSDVLHGIRRIEPRPRGLWSTWWKRDL